jgi:hypothetical protein
MDTSYINSLSLEQLKFEGNSCSSCHNLLGYKPSRRLGTNKNASLSILQKKSDGNFVYRDSALYF